MNKDKDNVDRKAFMIELVELLDRHNAGIDISTDYDGEDLPSGETVSFWNDSFDITVNDDFLEEIQATRKAMHKQKSRE